MAEERAWFNAAVVDEAGEDVEGATIAFTKTDGSALGQSLYAAKSGGVAQTTHVTDNLGTMDRFADDPSPVLYTVNGGTPRYGHFAPDPSQVVRLDATQTLTAKTLTAPTLTAPVVNGGMDVTANSSTLWAQKLRNADAMNGRALLIRNPEDTADVLSVRRTTSGEDILIIGYDNDLGGAGLSLCRTFVYKNIDTNLTGYSMSKFEFDAGATANGDYGALGAVARQTGGGAAFVRALEGHAVRMAPSTSNFTWGAEIGVHTNVVGDGITKHVGMFLYSDNNFLGGGGVSADTGLWLGGNLGFFYPIRITAKDNTTVLFSVEQGAGETGTVTCGHVMPRAASTYVLGSEAVSWYLSYLDFVLAGEGAESGPSYAFQGTNGTEDGMYHPALNTVAFGTDLTERLRLDAVGNVVVGKAALATNATSGFLYIPASAGPPSGTPTSYTGRVPLHIDSTNSKIYAYIGGAWKATAALT